MIMTDDSEYTNYVENTSSESQSQQKRELVSTSMYNVIPYMVVTWRGISHKWTENSLRINIKSASSISCYMMFNNVESVS